VLTAAIAILVGGWLLRTGIHQGVDTATYSRWADALIEARFNFAAYLREQHFVAPPMMYLAWVTVVAALKSILGASWMAGVVAFNWIAFTIGVYATLSAVRMTTRSGAGLLTAAALFIVAGDLLIFVSYVLSDLMFWGLSAVVLSAAVALIAGDAGPRASPIGTIVIGSVATAIAFTFRPVAVPLLVIWLMAIGMRAVPNLFARLAVPILVMAPIVAAAAIIVHACLMQNPTAWPLGSPPGMLQMVATEYRAGIVVHQADPPVLVAPPIGVAGFAGITIDKLAFFITPWLPYYSAAHQAINLLFFVPAYGLTLLGLRNIRRLTSAQQNITLLLSLYIWGVALFHAMSLIDSDHRYRLPLLPAFIMLAAVGLESARRHQTLASSARTK